MRTFWIGILGALVLTASFGIGRPTQAGDCGYGHCFGALGVTSAAHVERTLDQRTAKHAADDVNHACGSDGCADVYVFVDGCAAIARGRSGTVFAGFEASAEAAQSQARAICESAEGQGCYPVTQVCTR